MFYTGQGTTNVNTINDESCKYLKYVEIIMMKMRYTNCKQNTSRNLTRTTSFSPKTQGQNKEKTKKTTA